MKRIGFVTSCNDSEITVSTFKSRHELDLEVFNPNLIIGLNAIKALGFANITQYKNSLERDVFRAVVVSLNTINVPQLTHLRKCWKKRLEGIQKDLRALSEIEIKKLDCITIGKYRKLIDEESDCRKGLEEIEATLRKIASAKIGIVTFVGVDPNDGAFIEAMDETATDVRDIFCYIDGNDYFVPGEVVKIIDGRMFAAENITSEDVEALKSLERYHQAKLDQSLMAATSKVVVNGNDTDISSISDAMAHEVFILQNIRDVINSKGNARRSLNKKEYK
jgi:hypothetical protein